MFCELCHWQRPAHSDLIFLFPEIWCFPQSGWSVVWNLKSVTEHTLSVPWVTECALSVTELACFMGIKRASAPEEEHLFAVGMHHATVHSKVRALARASVMWSQNVCLLNVSLLPCSFRPACPGVDGERSYSGFACVLPINSWLPGLQSLAGPLLDCQLSSHPNIDIHSLNQTLTGIVGLSLTLAEVHWHFLYWKLGGRLIN